MESVFIELLSSFGPTVSAIAFFVWRDWKREDAQRTDLNIAHSENAELQKWIRDSLVAMIADVKSQMATLSKILENCPCFGAAAKGINDAHNKQ